VWNCTWGFDCVAVSSAILSSALTLAVSLLVAYASVRWSHRRQREREQEQAEAEEADRQDFDRRLAALGVARGNAIDVRADGRLGPLTGQALTDWVQAAVKAEQGVIDRGNEVTEALGSLVNWYDTVSDLPYTGFPDPQRQRLWNLSGVSRKAEQVILTSYRR